MIGRTNAGGGSGGNSAGLKIVVGTAEPSSPKENTIWVKSASASKKYVFAETEPGSPETGLIWFTATSAGIITRADVYTGGAWVAADTYMYLSGAWVQIASAWNGELFDNGNLYMDYTGGWPAVSGTLLASDPYLLYSAGAERLAMSSGKKIDITNFSQLHIIGGGRGDYANQGGVSSRDTIGGIATKVDNEYNGVKYTASVTLAKMYTSVSSLNDHNTEQVLDITSFSGEYYIAVSVSMTESHTNANIGIKKMWLS